jgi:hypothetical protein
VVELSDPAVPESRQPYHAVLEAPVNTAAHVEKRLRHAVELFTQRSLRALYEQVSNAGYVVREVGLVVGSRIEPSQIKNDHIRAHALEGQLFRTALEEAARSLGWRSLVLVERSAYTEAASALGKPEGDLKRAVAELGRALAGSWRAEEKMAALAAWMALARST